MLQEQKQKNEGLGINTMREAADYFYMKKDHLSNSTVHNAENRTIHNSGAYEQAIEHFISKNDIADLSPRLAEKSHFEKIIFKPDIKTPTRWFYFKQLRVFWNKLLDWNIVKNDYLASIKKDMPKKRSNLRPKMLSQDELHLLFRTFDKELERKRARPDWDESLLQHWFKPLMAVYFYCGLRRSEAAYNSKVHYSGLKGKNLQYDAGELATIYLTDTKGRKERVIPIPKPCKRALLTYLDVRGTIKPDDYVFIYLGGFRKGWPVRGEQAYKKFKHYLKKAGLPKSRTLHGLRHERVTTWIEKGFNPAEAQFMAGHTSIKITEGYTHLTGKNLYEKMRRMEEGK
jgi:integrase